MMKLIKLEIKKNNLKPYLYGVAVIFFVVLSLGSLFCAIPILEPNDSSSQKFTDPVMVITMISIISMSAFSILASVMYSKFVVEEYTGKKNVLLFTYPQKRSSILFAKFVLIFSFVFIMMFGVNIIACLIVGLISNLVGLVSQPFLDIGLMAKLSFIFAFVANFIGLIALRVGFYKKSIIVPVVTATMLTSPFGNLVALLGVDSFVVFIGITIILLILSMVLFFGLLKKVNEMECI